MRSHISSDWKGADYGQQPFIDRAKLFFICRGILQVHVLIQDFSVHELELARFLY
jgi:hypothetical protein